MKKVLVFIGIVTVYANAAFADPYTYAKSISSDSRTVTLSTTAASPTLLLNRDSGIERTWIVNSSTFTLYVSSTSNNLSTSSFGIPGTGATTNPPVMWTPDGPNAPYDGPLYGYTVTQSPPSISIFISK